MLVAPICHLELKCLGLCLFVLIDLVGAMGNSDFVTPKFQVNPTSVSCTSKNGWEFSFPSAGLVLLALFYVCFDIYNSLFYVISVFLLLVLFFYLFFVFYVDFLFLFIHYSSVSFYLDLVAWIPNFLGELNQIRSIFKTFYGRIKPKEKLGCRAGFSLFYRFLIFLYFVWRIVTFGVICSLLNHSIPHFLYE